MILCADNLSLTRSGKLVLDRVSTTLEPGKITAICGPNGAGKSTLLMALAGLLQPKTGRAMLAENELAELHPQIRAQRIGYLPQEASIFRGLNVEDNINAVLEIIEPDKQKRRQKLEDLLKEFSIEHIRKSHAMALSGGERRRAEIARAIACNPSFILLDEPFAGVDPIAVGDIMDMISHLKERNIGVLITDHNVREMLGICHHAYIMNEGRVLAEGNAETILANEDVREVYLGSEFRL